MNIVLLGATGYLGKSVLEKLSINNNVYCVVRPTSNYGELAEKASDIVFSDLVEVEKLFSENSVDWVINTVCTYKMNDSLYGDMMNSNISFPMQVLNIAIKYEVRNFMTIGTSLPYRFNFYSFSKKMFSDCGKFFSELNNINFIDLQLEMFYGGRYEPENRFLKSCRNKLKTNSKISLTDGCQKRDIIHISDVVSIIEKLITTKYISGYAVLPVGSGEAHSIREILCYMKKTMDSNSYLAFGEIPCRENEPETKADISWYKDIDYSLKYSYFEGLRKECEL